MSEQEIINYLMDELIPKIDDSISLNSLKDKVKNSGRLSDLKDSVTRSGEKMYEQKCRNLWCHRSFPKDKISYENQVFTRIAD